MSPPWGSQTDLWAKIGFYTSLGFILPSAVVGGVILGWYLDQWLHTEPVLAIILGALGAVAGFIEILRLMTRAEKRDERNNSSNRPRTS